MKTPPTTYQLAHLAALLTDATRYPDPEGAVSPALKLWKEADKQLAIEADFAAKQKPQHELPALTSSGLSVICPHCNEPMTHTADVSLCCYSCKEAWSLMAAGPEPEV